MQNKKTSGILYAVAAYSLWGILPIYWRLITSVFPIEILSNRIVWAFVFTIAIITVTKQWDELKNISKDKKQILSVVSKA